MKDKYQIIEKNHIDEACQGGRIELLASLNKMLSNNEPLNLIKIYESNGLDDAIWALRFFDYKYYSLFLADVADTVLSVFEAMSDDLSPQKCIQAIRDHHAGLIDDQALAVAATAASFLSVKTTGMGAREVNAAAAAWAAWTAAAATATATVNATMEAAGRIKILKPREIRILFFKHFDSSASQMA